MSSILKLGQYAFCGRRAIERDGYVDVDEVFAGLRSPLNESIHAVRDDAFFKRFRASSRKDTESRVVGAPLALPSIQA